MVSVTAKKYYETLVTNEKCICTADCGMFYRVIADKLRSESRELSLDEHKERNTFAEFNSKNTRLLNVEELKCKLLTSQPVADGFNL